MIGKFGKVGIFGLTVTLAACGGGRNETILPGTRLDPRDGLLTQDVELTGPNRSAAISLGQPVSRASWDHTGGNIRHASGHNAFTAGVPSVAWASEIGAGNSRKFRITADPVAAGGLVIALDSGAQLTAVSASSGQVVWSANLIPPGEPQGGASGGVLAIDGGTVYATTGYGEVVAIELQSGGIRWRQNLDAVGTSGLTVSGGLAYVVAGDSRVWAVNTSNGRVKWQVPGADAVTTRTGAASPAVGDRLVVVPFSAGQVAGLFRSGGTELWTASVAGQRAGVVYANVSDITSDPVIVGNTVYVGNQSGRFAAFDLDTGDRKWTANEGAYSPSLVIGGSVFIVTDRAELVRLSASTGERIWGQPLPFFTNDRERKRKAVYANYGPVAAGGRLWVASSDGVLRGYSPDNGALTAQVNLPAGAASNPIVVGGVMYITLEDGRLAAIR